MPSHRLSLQFSLLSTGEPPLCAWLLLCKSCNSRKFLRRSPAYAGHRTPAAPQPCAWSSAGTGTPVPACSDFSTLCVIVRRFHSAAGVLRAALCGPAPARKAVILQRRLVHPPTPFHAAFVVPAQLCPPFDVPADPLASPSPSYFYSIPYFSRFGHSH